MTLRSSHQVLRDKGFTSIPPNFHDVELEELRETITDTNDKEWLVSMIAAEAAIHAMNIVGFDYSGAPEFLIILTWCEDRIRQITADSN